MFHPWLKTLPRVLAATMFNKTGCGDRVADLWAWFKSSDYGVTLVAAALGATGSASALGFLDVPTQALAEPVAPFGHIWPAKCYLDLNQADLCQKLNDL